MKPGDVYRLDLVTTTDGRLERNVTVAVRQAKKLGCGCRRLTATRPGPADGPLGDELHLHVARCPFHQANSPDGGPEPALVEGC